MRKVSEKCRRAFSAILAAAMVLTSAPGTTMPVLAAEQTAVVTEVSDADEMTADEIASEDGADDADTGGADNAGKDSADDAGKDSADDAGKDGTDGTDDAGKDGADDADKSSEDAADDAEKEAAAGETALESPLIYLEYNERPLQSGLFVPNSATVYVTFTAEEGASVKYTLNGDDPVENGTVGTSVAVSTSNLDGEEVTVKAVAVKGELTSEVAGDLIVFSAKSRLLPLQLEKTPSDGCSANRVDASFKLTSPNMEDSSVKDKFIVKYYISDNTLDEASAVAVIKERGIEYTSEMGAVTVTAPDQTDEATRTVYAMAIPKADYVEEWRESECSSAVFTFAEKLRVPPYPPTIVMKNSQDAVVENDASVANDEVVTVTMTAAEGMDIYYTDDGTEPTTASAKYTDAISLSTNALEGESKTIIAIAYDPEIDLCSTWSMLARVVFSAAEPDPVAVQFDGNLDFVDIEVKDSDGEVIDYMESEAENRINFLAGDGEELSVHISAKTGCTLDTVELSVAGKASKKTVKNNACSFSFEASAYTWVSVAASENITGFTVTDDTSKTGLTQARANTYNVNSRNSYTITGMMGADNHKVSFTSVELKEAGGKAVSSETSSAVLSEDKKSIKLTVGADLEGKTVTVTATAGKTESKLTFTVAKILTKVTVQGVKKNALNQEIGKKMEYKLTLTPANAQDEIGAVVCSLDGESKKEGADCVESIEIKNGKLVVETTKEKGEASVILYNKTSVDARGGKAEASKPDSLQGKEKLGEFTLKVSDPAWKNQSPTVKLAQATDKKLYLSFTSPADMDGLYYEVKWSREKSNDVSRNNAGVAYFGPEHGNSDKDFIQVFDDEAAGEAAQFEVKARIVWMKDGEKPSEENPAEEENTLCMSMQSRAVTMSTKNPYYADKITLKKGKTTIYSGQQDVQAATISFGKNTSFVEGTRVSVLEKDFGDTSEYYRENCYVRASLDGINKVKVSVGRYTKPGKYTVRVTAPAEDGVKAATADLTITVAAGLNSFSAYGSTENIYLANNKAGSASIKIAYDYYNSEYQPKTPKFTYTVGRMTENGFVPQADVLTYTEKNGKVKNAVTVKNGKITVNKSYVVKGDSSQNTFTVCVAANDYAGNQNKKYISFVVTGKKQELGKLVLRDYDSKKVIADEDIGEISMGELENAQAIVVKEDARPDPETQEYSSEDVLELWLYTLSVKGKEIEIDEYGRLYPTKPGRSITITAATMDGGNQKASLQIKRLTYDEIDAEKAGVVWEEMSEYPEIIVLNAESENDIMCFTGIPFFLVAAADAQADKPITAKKSNNLSIQVSGDAKVLYDYSQIYPEPLAKNQRLEVILTGPKAKVTLKQGSKRLKTYQLVSSAAEKETEAPKIKASNEKLFVGKSDQTLTFEVDDRAATIPEGAAVYYTPTDARSEEYLYKRMVIPHMYIGKYEGGVVKLPVNYVYKAGSGSVRFFFAYEEDGQMKLTKLTNSVRITASEMKKSFSLTNKYKMSPVDAARVRPQYKDSGADYVVFSELKNANVKGKATDLTAYLKYNIINGYIELTDYGISHYDEIAGSTKEGYLCGMVLYEDNTRQDIEAKITVSFAKDGKTVNSYKASNLTLAGTISENALINSKITVKTGKNEVCFRGAEEQVKIKEGKEYQSTALYTAYVNDRGELRLDLSKAYENWAAGNMSSDLTANLQIRAKYSNGGKAWNAETGEAEDIYVPINVKVVIKRGVNVEKEVRLTAPAICVSLSGNSVDASSTGGITLPNRQSDVTFTLELPEEEKEQRAVISRSSWLFHLC